MPAKIDVVNEALILSGNDPVATEDDGSPEWNVGSAAYEAALRHLLNEHDWKFATEIETVNRTGDSPDSEAYDDEYAKPDNCLQIVWVKVDGVLATDYKIVRNRIQVMADASATVQVKYVLQPDPTVWSGLFGQAMHCFTLAGIYRGLNEDGGEAAKQDAKGEGYLTRARTRGDQEEPARPGFVSRVAAARRVRRG